MHTKRLIPLIFFIATTLLGSGLILSTTTPVSAQDVIPTLTPTQGSAPATTTQTTNTSTTNQDTVPVFIPTNTPVPTPTPIPNARIITEPVKEFPPLYADVDQNGVQEEDELVGYFHVFNWNEPIVFEWDPLPHEIYFPTASYRISLYQYPLGVKPAIDQRTGFPGNGREIKVAHHWAKNPNGLQFIVNSFGFDEALCFGCVTQIVIVPEVYYERINGASGTVEYFYGPANPTGGTAADLTIVSIPFVIEPYPRPGVDTPVPPEN